MSESELDHLLEKCEPSRREFLKSLILGTAYAAPLVTSFGMVGLGGSPASAASNLGLSNLCDGLPGNMMANETDVIVRVTASQSPVPAGGTQTYTVEAYNCGPEVATNVVIADQLPADTEFVSSSQTFGPAFVLNEPMVGEDAGLWEASAASLSIGDTVCFEIVVTVTP
ncbi:MAG: DUF11 domain-containing protein [Acidobacteriota bacterium]